MATDTQQTTTAVQSGSRVMRHAVGQLRQFLCGLHGHDTLMHFEQRRMSLQCTSCGFETPGWDVGSDHTTRATAGADSPRIVRLPIVRARRVA